MKYYIIVGEASGDLHASKLMSSLKRIDPKAEFRYFGGDCMMTVGGTRVKHYKELAYMGFVPVLLHLRTIFRNMALCKQDIVDWNPDVVILVDYPGFNLKIAKYLKSNTNIPAYYYISPKIWAWKEYRIKNIKRDISKLFSILPFEKDFFERKYNYPITYVGNPTSDEVNEFKANYKDSKIVFCKKNNLDTSKKIIALLAGSRIQEIKDNLPTMIESASLFCNNYQIVIAGAPSISKDYYNKFISNKSVSIVFDKTYELLYHADIAVVTSGTATLETALFNIPQVVCYETPIPKVIALLRKLIIKVPYISLVNLIAGKEVVKELVADTFSKENITNEISNIIENNEYRQAMLDGYCEIRNRLGKEKAPDNTARLIFDSLK